MMSEDTETKLIRTLCSEVLMVTQAQNKCIALTLRLNITFGSKISYVLRKQFSIAEKM
jgi:hypothetical protein